MFAFGQARFRAGRRDGGIDHFGVASRIDRARLRLAAARADVGHHAFLRAGRGRRDCALIPGVADDLAFDMFAAEFRVAAAAIYDGIVRAGFFAGGGLLVLAHRFGRGVAERIDRLRSGVAAARAGVGHHAFLRAGRGRRDCALIPGVADDLAFDMFAAEFRVAAAAIYDGIVRAGFFAGGGLLVLAHRFGRGVAERIDRLRSGVAAARAGVGHHAFLRAGRGRRDLAIVPGVAECGDDFLLDKNFVADGAMLAFRQASLRAGRCNGGVDRFGVTCRLDRARLRLAAGAGALLFSFFRARRRDGHYPFAEVMFVRVIRFRLGLRFRFGFGAVGIVWIVRVVGIVWIVRIVRAVGIVWIVRVVGIV